MIRGLDNVLGNIGRLVAQVEGEACERIISETASLIEASAKRLCPVDTGKMLASITKIRENAKTYHVSVNVHYASYVEFGTSRMRAQPFLRPALEANRALFMQRMRNIV